ncbi:sulfide/dihydroorotate dehydrogenase-like FAD/NAD-binding protein [candidate division KSB1 bacterium]|nr:sulfide/dihydroorotate dehydrogenase-like FAD/NAD-binding protein [candidate division KSB1 bacterium]
MQDYEITEKQQLAPQVTQFEVYAPDIAAKRQAGQFVIIRIRENGERIPLTIADANAEKGTITLISQSVGKTTKQLAEMKPGQRILDIAGPLGKPTHIEKVGTVVCIGGGIGIAPLHPITQAMKKAGNYIITILGARTSELVILKDKMADLSDEVIITTDDGSEGLKGFVTTALQTLIDSGRPIDLVITIGPSIMMKMVAEVTRGKNIPTVASLNTIMIDGTGMCGGCRITAGGKTQFVCVDGPEFDAHQVEWDEMIKRLGTYREHECRADQRYVKQQNN